MKVAVRIEGIDAVQAMLRGNGQKVTRAAATAMNRTIRAVRFDIVDKVKAGTQGGATSYTQRAFGLKEASEGNLEASTFLRDDAPAKGTPWSKALGHLFTGGSRSFKKMEGAFRRIRALPSGWMIVPGSACPLDGFGNPPRSLIVQLIAYFNAFGEQGYKANMKDKRRAKLANAGRTASGYKTINGVEYFISYGRYGKPGGDRYTHGKFSQHLAPGIWARSGTHGSKVVPIFMFVRRGQWAKKFDIDQIGTRTVDRLWSKNFDAAMRTIK